MSEIPSQNTPSQAASVLQAILDTTVDGLVTIDDRGRVLSFNRACEQIFGYTAEEVLGRNVSMLMPEHYSREHDGYLARYQAGGEARVIGIGREVEGRRKDGSCFPLDLAVARVEVDDRLLFSGIVRDISARKRAEAEIAEKSAELTRFAFMASHDLKEPLRGIEAFAELLMLDYGEVIDEDGRNYLNILMSSAARMRTIVNDVLEYSRLEAEADVVETFSADDVLQQVLTEMASRVADTGAVIKSGALPGVRGDRIRFYRLLQNLLSNALKYRSETQDPQISISAEKRTDDWVVTVQDNGIGIGPEYLESVFEMFKRLHSRDSYSGTGIGLAVCRRIVEHWGGRIWVESVPGQGSAFRFTLPAKIVTLNF